MPRIAIEAEQHQRIGQTLFRVQQALGRLDLPYAKTGKVAQAQRRASDAIRRLRCELDAQAARDLGDEFDTRLYYPGRDPIGGPPSGN